MPFIKFPPVRGHTPEPLKNMISASVMGGPAMGTPNDYVVSGISQSGDTITFSAHKENIGKTLQSVMESSGFTNGPVQYHSEGQIVEATSL